MKLPRDLDADTLVALLTKLGYRQTNTTGSHIRLTTLQYGEHHVTVPRHSPLRVGTLHAILRDVERYFSMSREEILDKLFDNR